MSSAWSNETSEDIATSFTCATRPQQPPTNSSCKETATINDWLRQYHQQQQTTETNNQLDALVIVSDATVLPVSATTPTQLDVDMLTEMTESERDYQMDLNLVDSDVTGPADDSVLDLPLDLGGRQGSTSRDSLPRQRWTAYDNVVDSDKVLRQNVDNEHHPDGGNDDYRHIDEILRQCAEYEQRSCDFEAPPVTADSKSLDKNEVNSRLHLDLPQNPPKSPRLSPSPSSATAGSTSPSGGVSSKIKTNGSLTSPIHGRRLVVATMTSPSVAPSSDQNLTVPHPPSTDFRSPCWLEMPATMTTSGTELIDTEEYQIDNGHCLDLVANGDGDYDEPFGDWSEESNDDVMNSDQLENERRSSTVQSYTQVAEADLASCRMSGPVPACADIRHSKDVGHESEVQLQVLAKRMNDIEELEEKAIREVIEELDAVDDVMAAEMSEFDAAGHRLSIIQQQQMELLLEAAKEREEADRQMALERRRLKSMERTCREINQQLQSRDLDCSRALDDDTDDVELRMTLHRQQDSVDCQRRLIDDLEFQLLELETRREAEREPYQKKLLAERSKHLQTSSMKKISLQSLYLQKLELVAQAKADVADLGKEYQLLLDAFVQEKQKVERSDFGNDISTADPHKTNSFTYEVTKYCSIDAVSSESVDHPPSCTSPFSWKQGTLWRTLIELEANIVNDRPPFAEDSDTGQHYTETNPQRSRDCDSGTVEFERSSDDISYSGLSRDRDIGVFNSGNTLDDIDDFVGGDSPRCNEAADGGKDSSGTTVLRDQVEDTACDLDTWCQSLQKVDINKQTSPNGVLSTDSSVSNDRITYREKRTANRQSRPMTRYLPVRDHGLSAPSPFNLRQFVESAGHVVDDTTIHVTPVACHGWLVKMAGSRRLHVWHRRYFLFDRTWRTFSWYSASVNPSTVAPPMSVAGNCRSCIPFESIVDVFVDHLQKARRSPSPPLTFCIKTRDRSLYVVAPKPETMRIWIDVLVTGAEGYGEFL